MHSVTIARRTPSPLITASRARVTSFDSDSDSESTSNSNSSSSPRSRSPSGFGGAPSTPHWDPNHVCAVTTGRLPAALYRQKRNLTLVSKLLALDKPVVTQKMIAFMRQDSVPPLLCNFLTRATPFEDDAFNGGPADTTPRAGAGAVASTSGDGGGFEIDDPDEIHAIKLGHRVMNLLVSSNSGFTSFVDEHLHIIVTELFRIFEPEARGNFHHLLFVIKKIAADYGEDLLRIVAEEHLLCQTVPYVHLAPVAELVILLLTSGNDMPYVRQQLYQQLADCSFLAQIVASMLDCEEEARAFDILYFLLQVMDALQVEIHADILLQSLSDERLLDALVAGCGIDGEYEPHQRRLCVDFVHALLKKSEKSVLIPFKLGGKPMKFHNMAAVLQKAVVDAVARNVASLAFAAVPKSFDDEEGGAVGAAPVQPAMSPGSASEDGEKVEEREKGTGTGAGERTSSTPRTPRRRHSHSHPKLMRNMSEVLLPTEDGECAPTPNVVVRYGKYQVDRLFTTERTLLLEILGHAASVSPDACLDCVKPYFWRRLVDWLFEYSHNNIYHNAFLQLFRAAVLADHWPSMVELLSERCNLVDRLYDAYQHSPDLRGHVILIGNILRLKAETLPGTAFLRKRLNACKTWKAMCSAVTADSRKQAGIHFNMQRSVLMNFAPPAVQPLAPNGRPMKELEYSEMLKLADPEDEGVDLGSTFANQLGFVGAGEFEEDDDEEDADTEAEQLAREVEEELALQEAPQTLYMQQ